MIDIETLLMKELSRRNMEYAAHCIGDDREEFDRLMKIVLYGKPPVVQRAAWAMDACLENHTELILPYTDILIDTLPSCPVDGVKRQIVKVLAELNISESRQGPLADLCFQWVQSSTIPVAVKIHCMQILANITAEHPDLSVELQTVIREQIPRNSVGFASRAKKILRRLSQTDCFE